MPIYVYECIDGHGINEAMQGMNDIHTANCPLCGKAMRRVFTPTSVRTRKAKLGNTREELFNNLAAEGRMGKEWKEHDDYYKKAKGITDG
jgi:putative FmdB family regulatory protein